MGFIIVILASNFKQAFCYNGWLNNYVVIFVEKCLTSIYPEKYDSRGNSIQLENQHTYTMLKWNKSRILVCIPKILKLIILNFREHITFVASR